MEYMIGVDLGTTSTKVVLFDLKGKVLGSANNGYPLYRDKPDRAEQDPHEILSALIKGLIEVSNEANIKPGELKLVSFSSALHSLIALDENWNLLTRVITWADNRAVDYSEEMKRTGIGQKIYEKTGTPIHPMAPLSKIQWLRDNEPETFKKTKHYLDIKSWIFHELFNTNKMDLSIATGTGLYNIFESKWHDESLKIDNITSDQLPEVVDTLHYETGDLTDVFHGIDVYNQVPFVFGAGDGPLSNLGVDAVDKGVAAITIGTSGAVRVVSKKPVIDKKGRTFTYALTKDFWVVGGPVNSGGSVFKWSRDNLFDSEKSTAELLGKDSYDLLTEIAEKVPAGADGLLFHPYLGGERAPIWNANARASFFGLNQNHNRSNMIRSVLEGIVFNIRMVSLALEEVVDEITEIRATGGFARSQLWRQILADIFEQNITVPQEFESGALAAAVVGMKAVGLADDFSIIKDMIGEVKTYHPKEENFENYRELLPIFIRLTRELEKEYDSIAEYQRIHQKNKT